MVKYSVFFSLYQDQGKDVSLQLLTNTVLGISTKALRQGEKAKGLQTIKKQTAHIYKQHNVYV